MSPSSVEPRIVTFLFYEPKSLWRFRDVSAPIVPDLAGGRDTPVFVRMLPFVVNWKPTVAAVAPGTTIIGVFSWMGTSFGMAEFYALRGKDG